MLSTCGQAARHTSQYTRLILHKHIQNMTPKRLCTGRRRIVQDIAPRLARFARRPIEGRQRGQLAVRMLQLVLHRRRARESVVALSRRIQPHHTQRSPSCMPRAGRTPHQAPHRGPRLAWAYESRSGVGYGSRDTRPGYKSSAARPATRVRSAWKAAPHVLVT